MTAPLRAAAGLAALALVGCPKKAPPIEIVRAPGEPAAPTLLERWDALDLSLYADVILGPAAGQPMRSLARAHDVDRYALSLAAWGPPERWVLEIEDQDPRNTVDGGPLGAWVLSGTPGDPEVPVSYDALLHGEPAGWVVSSVLLRDWADSPRAADPFDLLLAEHGVLPAPWVVCRPRTEAEVAAEEADDAEADGMLAVRDPVRLFAHDPDRGVRVALVPATDDVALPLPGDGPFTWTVDHLEFASTKAHAERGWAALGFADCVEVGRVLGEDRARRPKEPFGPPPAG